MINVFIQSWISTEIHGTFKYISFEEFKFVFYFIL